MFVLKVRFVAKLLQKVIQYWQHVPKRMWTLSRTTCIGWLGVFLRSLVQVRKGLLYQPSLIYIYIYTYMYGWDQDTINGLYLFSRGYWCLNAYLRFEEELSKQLIHLMGLSFHIGWKHQSVLRLSGWAQCRRSLLCVTGPNWLHIKLERQTPSLYIYIYMYIYIYIFIYFLT